jgi:hypothetical protein
MVNYYEKISYPGLHKAISHSYLFGYLVLCLIAGTRAMCVFYPLIYDMTMLSVSLVSDTKIVLPCTSRTLGASQAKIRYEMGNADLIHNPNTLNFTNVQNVCNAY